MKTTSVPLGEVCTILMGQSPPSSSYNNSGDGLPFFQGKVDFGDLYPRVRVFCNEPTRTAKAGDILISVRAPVGPTNVALQECCIGRGLGALRAGKKLCPTFLLYYLRYSEPRIAYLGQGSTFQAINRNDLESLSILLPDPPKQRQIAAALEQADRMRRTCRYALELDDEFLPAAFHGWFADGHDWPAYPVEKLAAAKPNAIRTGPFGSQLLHSEFTRSGIAVLGIDNAVNNRFEWQQRRFISPAKYEELRRYTVHPGDVIITIMGTCGRCAIVPDEIPTAINTKHLCCITLDRRKCLPIYLQAAFLHHPAVQQSLGTAQKGAIMDGLNMEIIRSLSIPIPPLPLQQRFATLVTQHERQRARHCEALRQADHLFQTLLHQSFASER